MRRIAPMSYELGPAEGCTMVIDAVGTAYLAFGSVNGHSLQFASGVPAAITPNMLSAPDRTDRIHVHLVYQGATPAAAYDVRVLDDAGNEMDAIRSTIPGGIAQPYRDDIDLVVREV